LDRSRTRRAGVLQSALVTSQLCRDAPTPSCRLHSISGAAGSCPRILQDPRRLQQNMLRGPVGLAVPIRSSERHPRIPLI
jgi:hypothetical protein